MHISEGLDRIVDKVHRPTAIWHRSLGCECGGQLYYHLCIVDVSGDLVEVFFKSHDSLTVVSFYIGFECMAEDIQGHLIDVPSDA